MRRRAVTPPTGVTGPTSLSDEKQTRSREAEIDEAHLRTPSCAPILPNCKDKGGNPAFLRTARTVLLSKKSKPAHRTSPRLDIPHRLSFESALSCTCGQRRTPRFGSKRLAGPTGLVPTSLVALQGVDRFPEKAARRLVVCWISRER